MLSKKAIIEVNANFHHLSGESLFDGDKSQFKEYRKKWDEWPRNFYVGEFPLFLDIEVTNECNLHCPFCQYAGMRGKVKKGRITTGIIKKIIDEGADHGLYGVKFNIWGEPLLHPKIHEFVKYAKQKGLIDVYFNTNAMLLDEGASRKLIAAGLDRISISFEGYTKSVYEKYRVGSNYEKVLSNIENLQALKKKLEVKYPKIRVQTVMLPDLENSFQEYRDFWALRADEVGFLDYEDINVKEGIRHSWACPQIWQRMGIWWDGTLSPCNKDFKALLSLGNVRDISIKEAWNCKKLNSLRQAHKNGKAFEVSTCDTCQLRNSQILMAKKRGQEI